MIGADLATSSFKVHFWGGQIPILPDSKAILVLGFAKDPYHCASTARLWMMSGQPSISDKRTRQFLLEHSTAYVGSRYFMLPHKR